MHTSNSLFLFLLPVILFCLIVPVSTVNSNCQLNSSLRYCQNNVNFYSSYYSLVAEIATSLLDLVTVVFIDLGSITAELVRPLRAAITTFITDMGVIALGTLNELMAIAVGSKPPPTPPYPQPPSEQTPEQSITLLRSILDIYEQTTSRLLCSSESKKSLSAKKLLQKMENILSKMMFQIETIIVTFELSSSQQNSSSSSTLDTQQLLSLQCYSENIRRRIQSVLY